jgi:hypothetical protein
MLEAMLNVNGAKPSPRGQVQWTTNGTYTWVCPADVFSVCFVIVAAGQSGLADATTAKGGTGGGLRYRNSVPVVPGQSYTIVVGATSSCMGTTVGLGSATSGTSSGGSAGTSGGSTTSSGARFGNGGGAGRYTTSSGGGGTSVSTPYYAGVDLLGSGSGSFGGGGWGYKDGNGGSQNQVGQPGGARIIWGNARSYPSAAA